MYFSLFSYIIEICTPKWTNLILKHILVRVIAIQMRQLIRSVAMLRSYSLVALPERLVEALVAISCSHSRTHALVPCSSSTAHARSSSFQYIDNVLEAAVRLSPTQIIAVLLNCHDTAQLHVQWVVIVVIPELWIITMCSLSNSLVSHHSMYLPDSWCALTRTKHLPWVIFVFTYQAPPCSKWPLCAPTISHAYSLNIGIHLSWASVMHLQLKHQKLSVDSCTEEVLELKIFLITLF